MSDTSKRKYRRVSISKVCWRVRVGNQLKMFQGTVWIFLICLRFAQTSDIIITGLYPMTTGNTTRGHQEGNGVLPAVNLAIRHVNEDPPLLTDHKLGIVKHDTKVRMILITKRLQQN